jgi:hypothetical protein
MTIWPPPRVPDNESEHLQERGHTVLVEDLSGNCGFERICALFTAVFQERLRRPVMIGHGQLKPPPRGAVGQKTLSVNNWSIY